MFYFSVAQELSLRTKRTKKYINIAQWSLKLERLDSGSIKDIVIKAGRSAGSVTQRFGGKKHQSSKPLFYGKYTGTELQGELKGRHSFHEYMHSEAHCCFIFTLLQL